MKQIGPCPQCGEQIQFRCELLPYASWGFAAVRCLTCNHMEGAVAGYNPDTRFDVAIGRFNGIVASARSDS